MQVPLLLAAITGLACTDGSSQGDVGKVQWEFPAGSTWHAINGMKGESKILSATVLFKAHNEVEVSWKARTGGGWFRCSATYQFTYDPVSHLPRIGNGDFVGERGSFRPLGNYLEFELTSVTRFANIHEPPGNLRLVLKQAK
jgi:hypothetical protein